MPETVPSDKQLRVGRLTKAHGLKGALKLELYTDDPERRFVPGAQFSLQVPPESKWHGQHLELAELRWYNTQPVGFFVGVNDRTEAESLAKAILWVDQDELSEEDAWYDHQLIGLSVLRDGQKVGKVARLEHLPAQDLLVVATGHSEVLVPFVTAIVPTVDVEAGHIVVTPPAGLFEELPEDDEGSEFGDGDEDGADDAEPSKLGDGERSVEGADAGGKQSTGRAARGAEPLAESVD